MSYSNGAITDQGVAYVEIDGERIDVNGTFTYRLTGYQRTPIDSTNRLAGHETKFVSGFVSFDAVDNADLDVAALQELKGATIRLELFSGKNIACYKATRIDGGEVDGGVGKIPLKFSGDPVEEV